MKLLAVLLAVMPTLMGQALLQQTYDPRSYQFTRTSGAGVTGSLASSGAKTVAVTPCPKGMSGTDVNHSIYVSNGTGTAEAVLITGGTCTPGAQSGTLAFTTANAHSGAWTISSATDGMQEAVNAGSTGGIVVAFSENITFHSALTFPSSGNVTIRGSGMVRVAVIRAADYPTGNLFQTNGGTVWIDLSDFEIFNTAGLGTSGASIYYNASGAGGFSNLQNIYIVNGSIGVKIDSGSNVILKGMQVHNYDATSNPFAALWITSTGATEPFGIFISDSGFGSIGAGRGFLLDAVDGLLASNSSFGGNYGIYFRGVTGGGYIANATFLNAFIDSPTTSALYFASNGASGPVQSVIKFVGGHFNGQNPITGVTGLGVGVDIGGGSGFTPVDYLDFIGCNITGFRFSGVSLNRPGAVHIGFYDNWIFDNNLSATATQSGMILANGTTGLSVENNDFSNTATGGQMNYAIAQFGTLDNSIIQGNRISGMTIAPFSMLGATTNTTRRNNHGVDNIIGVVSAAATIIFPANPNLTIVGTTGATAVNMISVAPGSYGTFRTTTGAVVFTATGGIGSAGTTVQNKLYQWFYDGTTVWIAGPGF